MPRSSPPERVAEQAVVRWARLRGIMVTKLNLWGHRGMPDRVFWLPGGRPLLAEFKRKGGKPTALQAHTHKLLREAGYVVIVIEEAKAGIALVENCCKAVDWARTIGEYIETVDAKAAPQGGRDVAAGTRRGRAVR